MYLTEQNVHVFDCRQNVLVFVYKLNVHEIDWTKSTCIWLNKMFMYLTINKMYMYLTEQNVYVFDCMKNVHVLDYKQNVLVVDCRQNVHVIDCKQNGFVTTLCIITCQSSHEEEPSNLIL
jgi:fucose 4-O-acetylase-like acetyltransferase